MINLSTWIKNLAIVSAILLVLGWHDVSMAAEATLKPLDIAIGEWKPYTGRQLEEYGVTSLVVSAIFHEMGYQTRYHFMSWDNAYQTALMADTNRDVRGTFPWFHVKERERDFYYSEPVQDTEMVIFFHSRRTPEMANITDFQDLRRWRGLLVKSYGYPEEIEKVTPGAERAPNDFMAFSRLLKDDKVQFIPSGKRVGKSVLRDYFSDESLDIKIVPTLSKKMKLHFISSRKNPHNRKMIQQFNVAMQRLKDRGELQALKQKTEVERQRRTQVLLESFAEQPLYAYIESGGSRAFLVPRGSRAVVIDWPETYVQANVVPQREKKRFCKVQLLNGPMQGHDAYVDCKTIRLQ